MMDFDDPHPLCFYFLLTWRKEARKLIKDLLVPGKSQESGKKVRGRVFVMGQKLHDFDISCLNIV